MKLFYGFLQAGKDGVVETRAVIMLDVANFNATTRAYDRALEIYPVSEGYVNHVARTYKIPDDYIEGVVKDG